MAAGGIFHTFEVFFRTQRRAKHSFGIFVPDHWSPTPDASAGAGRRNSSCTDTWTSVHLINGLFHSYLRFSFYFLSAKSVFGRRIINFRFLARVYPVFICPLSSFLLKLLFCLYLSLNGVELFVWVWIGPSLFLFNLFF